MCCKCQLFWRRPLLKLKNPYLLSNEESSFLSYINSPTQKPLFCSCSLTINLLELYANINGIFIFVPFHK